MIKFQANLRQHWLKKSLEQAARLKDSLSLNKIFPSRTSFIEIRTAEMKFWSEIKKFMLFGSKVTDFKNINENKHFKV